MTVSGQMFTSGARKGVVFPLEATTGFLSPPVAQPVATGYYGIKWEGYRAFQGNFPKARKLSFVAQDRVAQIDWLPPTEGMDATVQCSATDYALIAALGGQLVRTVGTAKMIQILTNKQGFEPTVAMQFIQQAEDLSLGIRRWQSYLLPASKAIFAPASMGDAEEMLTYDVAPSISRQNMFGTPLTEVADGTLSSQMGMLMTEGFPYVCVWRGDNSMKVFLFDPAIPALNATTAFIAVTKNGTAVTETQLTTGVTFASAPALGDIVIAVYEGAGQ
jgi:hypothetical protein